VDRLLEGTPRFWERTVSKSKRKLGRPKIENQVGESGRRRECPPEGRGGENTKKMTEGNTHAQRCLRGPEDHAVEP